ncbi:hypothetical protein NP233_g3615 [Leucocoprinus birnbaumii]|uniref:glutathione transferase n=1 Tax=Leucocoprinus birnbaumii TaxID=56174 RepID=A0AAD5VWV9_9AGAR|nr:hypothetical protein NP233_g3615 [Leucocoprinus birnbaumii]
MVLKFYGYEHSTASQIVAMVLREKKIPYEYIPIDLGKGEHKQPNYLAIQPFGQVPCIVEDDGFTLYESRAIARYLVENYPGGPELIPSERKKRGLFDQAVSVEGFNFERYVNAVIMEGLLPKFRNQPYNEERIKELGKSIASTLDVYEKTLAKSRYIAGDELTLADIYHLPGGNLLPIMGINLLQDDARPNVVRWWNEISKLESWQKVKDGLPGKD